MEQSIEDQFFPVTTRPRLNQSIKPTENQAVIKKIIQGAIRGSYQMKLPSSYDLVYQKDKLDSMRATEEQIEFVTHLIESLQPQDAIEATLASQYVISYLRGLSMSSETFNSLEKAIEVFRFGHEVLENLTKYRTKGAQQIQVNYNHNQGQINNIRVTESESKQEIIEVKNEL